MRYVIAENYLCFYAIIETVLSDIGVNKFSQYDLANEFGVVLPYGHSIPNVYNVIFSDEIYYLGAHVNEQKINSFFKSNEIELKISYIPENPYIDYDYDKFDCFITESNKYYIYYYSYGSLYHEAKNYNVGHVSLLLNCPSLERLEIYDPGPRLAGAKTIRRISMHDAMEDIRGGVYVVEFLRGRDK